MDNFLVIKKYDDIDESWVLGDRIRFYYDKNDELIWCVEYKIEWDDFILKLF